MRKIQNKLLLLLLAVSIIPASITEYFIYQSAKTGIKSETYNYLNATVTQRLHLMSEAFNQEVSQASIVANSPQIINEFEQLNSDSGYKISSSTNRFLSGIKTNRNLNNLYLINSYGDIKFSLNTIDDLNTNVYTSIFNQSHMASLVQHVLNEATPKASIFDAYKADNNNFTAFIAHPVMSNNTLLGAVVFQVTPSIFDSATTPNLTIGDTGEVLLAYLHNDKIQYTSPMRFMERNAQKFSLTLHEDMSHSMQHAVQGNSGFGESTDYRLKEIFAQWSFVEKFNLGMVVKIDRDQAMSRIDIFSSSIFLIFLVIAFPIIVIAFLIARHYTRPIIDMVHSTKAIANGDIEQELQIHSGDEIGQLATSINEMSNHINKAFKSEEADRWMQEGVVKLSETMRGNQVSTDLADNIVSFVCCYLNAKVGSLYIVKDQELELAGGFAFVPHFTNQAVEFGDGLVGQAAISKAPMTITDLPEDYISISSSLGEIAPRTLIVFPLIKDDAVVGVIELGWLDDAHEQTYNYLEAVSESISTALTVAESHQKLQILLDQSQQQMEELQVREEELRAINEEVEQRSTQLANSQKKLEQQSQELQLTNDALENKNSAIEAQNAEIEISRQEISEKAEQLEASSKYKSEFLANMSHELRTPLNSMLILSRILSDNDEGNLDDDQVESSKIIHRSGQELLSLINDILDLSKIEAGKMEVLYESYNVRDITYELNGQFKAITGEKGLSFDVIVDDNVPSAMAIDVQKVQQILKNLLSNAIKFTEHGGVTLTAKIASPDNKYELASLSQQPVLSISITDTGIGISEEKQKAIFEAFQQADGSTSRKYGGTGLGLTISRHLTSLLEGELAVTSVANQGSTFTLHIPIKEGVVEVPTDDEPMMISASSHTPDTTPPQSLDNLKQQLDGMDDTQKTVIIIEDDINFSKVLSSLATKSGFNPIVAQTGNTGLELVKKHKPCGVILDLGLPDLPGGDILDILKNTPEIKDIPVHVISGHNKKKELTDKGATAFHQKPIAPKDIKSLLSSLISSSDVHQQQLVVFDYGNSHTPLDLTFLNDMPLEIKAVGSLDELSHQLGNSCDSISGLIIKNQLLDIPTYQWINDNAQFITDKNISIIVCIDNELPQDQVVALEQIDCHVIIEGSHSNERLHDEVLLFLSNVEDSSTEVNAINHENEESPVVTNHTSIVPTANIEQSKPPETNTQASFNGCEVLLVDDDLRNTFSLSKVLKKHGMKVTLADNGQMALDRLNTNDAIDIVLMDIMMPVMDGHEAMRQIRLEEKYAKLPIIALTAKAMQEDRRKCVEAGASDYLTKPVDIDKLIAMMRVWLYQEVS